MIAQQADEKVTGTAISFHGFPKEAFTFLSALARNNNRAWFEAHRYDYDGAIVGPALVFIVSMGEALKTFAPSVKPEPRVGGSLFRIHRDTRFSTTRALIRPMLASAFETLIRRHHRSVRGRCSTPNSMPSASVLGSASGSLTARRSRHIGVTRQTSEEHRSFAIWYAVPRGVARRSWVKS